MKTRHTFLFSVALLTGIGAISSLPVEQANAFPGLNAKGRHSSLADVAAKTTPSVVNIATTKTVRSVSPFYRDPFFNHPGSPGYGQRDVKKANSLGSGVVVSKEGVILTNNHVVANADEIVVGLNDGREFGARLIGADPMTDVAVLKLKNPPGNLVPIKMGNSSKARIGEVVLAIGNPFGVGQTVTMGIVSATGRSNVGIVRYEDFIQTDAAINPGNSGGALVNMRGELIGINTAILSRSGGYQGVGLAIPSKMAGTVMSTLLQNGKLERGWLGISMLELSPKVISKFNVRATEGVFVEEVVSSSPAQRAGLRGGDVIVKVDGVSTPDTHTLRRIVATKGSGNRVKLVINRKGRTQTMQVTLGLLSKTNLGRSVPRRRR